MDVPKNRLAALMNYRKSNAQRLTAQPVVTVPKCGTRHDRNSKTAKARGAFPRRSPTMKRLTVIMFAVAAYGGPANAEPLSTFAYDGAGKPVLEFDPATVA